MVHSSTKDISCISLNLNLLEKLFSLLIVAVLILDDDANTCIPNAVGNVVPATRVKLNN
jgi:hypothetical protein